MILHRLRMLNGKLIFNGRHLIIKQSDKHKRMYADMKRMRKYI